MGQNKIYMGLPLARGQRKKRVRSFLGGFFVALILGTTFGYFWAARSYVKTYQIRLEQKEIMINHYRSHWTPIREVPVRHRVK